MREIIDNAIKASLEDVVPSSSLLKRRDRLIQPNVRSTTQRCGSTAGGVT